MKKKRLIIILLIFVVVTFALDRGIRYVVEWKVSDKLIKPFIENAKKEHNIRIEYSDCKLRGLSNLVFVISQPKLIAHNPKSEGPTSLDADEITFQLRSPHNLSVKNIRLSWPDGGICQTDEILLVYKRNKSATHQADLEINNSAVNFPDGWRLSGLSIQQIIGAIDLNVETGDVYIKGLDVIGEDVQGKITGWVEDSQNPDHMKLDIKSNLKSTPWIRSEVAKLPMQQSGIMAGSDFQLRFFGSLQELEMELNPLPR
jgi:hypothetical protein